MSKRTGVTAPSAAAPVPDATRSGSRALFAVCAATLLVLMNHTAPVAVLPQTARSLGAGQTGGFTAHGADAVLLLGTGAAVLGAAVALIRRRVTAPAPAPDGHGHRG